MLLVLPRRLPLKSQRYLAVLRIDVAPEQLLSVPQYARTRSYHPEKEQRPPRPLPQGHWDRFLHPWPRPEPGESRGSGFHQALQNRVGPHLTSVTLAQV